MDAMTHPEHIQLKQTENWIMTSSDYLRIIKPLGYIPVIKVMDGCFKLIGLFPTQEPVSIYLFMGAEIHPAHVQLEQTQ